MLRAFAAIIVLAATLAACGGGGDDADEPRDTRQGQSLAEWRLDVRNRCREHTERLIGGVGRLPANAAQVRRFEHRLLRRERRFLVGLRRVDAPAREKIGFRNALRDRTRAIDARLKGRLGRTRRLDASAYRRLVDKNLVDCAGAGAFGLPDGASYVHERNRACRRRSRALRRAARRARALPPGEAKLDAGLAVADRLRAFGRRTPTDGAAPPQAVRLERAGFREIRRAADAFEDLLRAARRLDDAAFERARRRLRRSAFRGAAAWWVLNVPGCEEIYRIRLA
jgi:hypothetical protein